MLVVTHPLSAQAAIIRELSVRTLAAGARSRAVAETSETISAG